MCTKVKVYVEFRSLFEYTEAWLAFERRPAVCLVEICNHYPFESLFKRERSRGPHRSERYAFIIVDLVPLVTSSIFGMNIQGKCRPSTRSNRIGLRVCLDLLKGRFIKDNDKIK